MLSYVRWQPDAYERAFHLPPNSVWKPDPFDDEEQPESSEKRDQVGGYVENDTFLPMRKPWLQTGNGGLNSQLNVAANNSGLANGPLPGGGNPPQNVGGFKRASAANASIDGNTDFYELIETESPQDAYNDMLNELTQHVVNQDQGDGDLNEIISKFQSDWANAGTSSVDQQRVLGEMADFITQYYQFYYGFLTSDVSGAGMPTQNKFFRGEGLTLWQSLENVRLAYGTSGEAKAEEGFLQQITLYVATVAEHSGDNTTILGLAPKIPKELSYRTQDLDVYLQAIVNFDAANGTSYGQTIAQMLFNRGPQSSNFTTDDVTQGFWGSYSGTGSDGAPITVYGNLFNRSEDASNAIVFQNPQAIAAKGTQSNELDQWQFFLQNEQVSLVDTNGSVSKTQSYTSLQFKVAIADAMSQIIMMYNQMYNGWKPSAADIAYQQGISGDQILIVAPNQGGNVVPPPPPTPTFPSTPDWEYVAYGAGGLLLVYLVFRAV